MKENFWFHTIYWILVKFKWKSIHNPIVAGKLYTIGGVQAKGVDQYDVETDTWSGFFPSLRHCRVAHGAVADGDTLYVTGGSAKVGLLHKEI